QAADLRGNLVGEQPVEPALRGGSGHLVLGEGGEIDETDALAHQARLVPHVLEVVAAPEAPAIPALDARRREPVGALPAVALSPDCAPGVEAVVHRARLCRSRVGALLVGKMDGEDVAVGLL